MLIINKLIRITVFVSGLPESDSDHRSFTYMRPQGIQKRQYTYESKNLSVPPQNYIYATISVLRVGTITISNLRMKVFFCSKWTGRKASRGC
jgi:hypothetical protein